MKKARMQRHDSELLFGDDAYQLLRDDSLLHRVGSSNFAALLEGDVLPPAQQNLPQEQQQLQEQHQHQQEQQPVAFSSSLNNQVLVLNNPNGVFYQVQQQQQQQQQMLPQMQSQHHIWDTIDIDEIPPDPLQIQEPQMIMQEPPHAPCPQEPLHAPCPPDTTGARSQLSLSRSPWPGRLSFSISLPTDNKDRNKWCFNEELNKLYLCPEVAVPVNVKLSEWIDASITVTPVFKQSQYSLEPVLRCYNCKCKQLNHGGDKEIAEHVVQVEGDGCVYEINEDRYSVTVPVRPPPPGEAASIILIKLMCLTSCVGGPNRRPFSLILTLRDRNNGREIGRQILDVKCCKCPSRDMINERGSAPRSNTGTPTTLDEDKKSKVRKLAAELTVDERRKKPKIKLEPGTETQTHYVNILVPEKFEAQVKAYVNGLVAADLLRRSQPDSLPYPERG